MIVTCNAKEAIQLYLTGALNLHHQFNVGDNIIIKAEFKEELKKGYEKKILERSIYCDIEYAHGKEKRT